VIRSPDQDLTIDGEILIAPMTDPGWVFLMVAAGGLVVEKGSLLSHTAIIGRELGVPTVVGVEGATGLIPDGTEIEIDGRAGTVRFL
jgi:pyruvate,water dikinase